MNTAVCTLCADALKVLQQMPTLAIMKHNVWFRPPPKSGWGVGVGSLRLLSEAVRYPCVASCFSMYSSLSASIGVQICPILSDLMGSMSKIESLPPDFAPKEKVKTWYSKLYSQSASYELGNDEVREVFFGSLDRCNSKIHLCLQCAANLPGCYGSLVDWNSVCCRHRLRISGSSVVYHLRSEGPPFDMLLDHAPCTIASPVTAMLLAIVRSKQHAAKQLYTSFSHRKSLFQLVTIPLCYVAVCRFGSYFLTLNQVTMCSSVPYDDEIRRGVAVRIRLVGVSTTQAVKKKNASQQTIPFVHGWQHTSERECIANRIDF